MRLVIVGGSDAGISAALRARELDPSTDVTVVVADAFPNYSICGIPYYVSGEVTHWRNLAHRTHDDLVITGMRLRLDTTATDIDVEGQTLRVDDAAGREDFIEYDELIVGTGARPFRPVIPGVDGATGLGTADGVHFLHSMADTFDLMRTLERVSPRRALIVGGGYIGLEMAEAFTTLGVDVVQVEKHEQVLASVDPRLGALLSDELRSHGVELHTNTRVTEVARTSDGLHVSADSGEAWDVDLVLVVVGVRPDVGLLTRAGARTGAGGAVAVDETMATGLPHVWAAGDGVTTHHRLLGPTYLPLGTTAHKQGRVAGENAIGGAARFAGSVGTQVVKVFDQVAARTGLRHDEAAAAGFTPSTIITTADDHKAYYPGSSPITISITGDRNTGRLLGAQMIGRRGTATEKRIDTFATAIFHGMTVDGLNELDLSYTPPLGSPWDAVQLASQRWHADHRAQQETDQTTVVVGEGPR